MTLTLYSRPGCHLCEDMMAVIDRLPQRASFDVQVIDVSSDPDLERRYGLNIPVLLINGTEAARHRVSERDLLRLLAAERG
jgi:glutaredoxin